MKYDTLKKLIDALSVVKIDDAIIEKNAIRGIDAVKSVVVFTNDEKGNVEFFDDDMTLRVARVPELKSVLNLSSDLQVKYKTNDDSVVQEVVLSNGRTNISYKCASPLSAKIPKAISGWEPVLKFSMSADDVQAVNNASKTINNASLILKANTDNAISMEFKDEGGSIDVNIENECERLNEYEDIFVGYYHKKSLLPLMTYVITENETVDFTIDKNKRLSITINDLNFIFVPRVSI